MQFKLNQKEPFEAVYRSLSLHVPLLYFGMSYNLSGLFNTDNIFAFFSLREL